MAAPASRHRRETIEQTRGILCFDAFVVRRHGMLRDSPDARSGDSPCLDSTTRRKTLTDEARRTLIRRVTQIVAFGIQDVVRDVARDVGTRARSRRNTDTPPAPERYGLQP